MPANVLTVIDGTSDGVAVSVLIDNSIMHHIVLPLRRRPIQVFTLFGVAMSPIFTRCLRPLAFAMVAVSLAALPYRTLSAQPPAKKVVTVKGAKSRGAATDPNVKVDSLPSNQAGAAPVAAPPNKGGPKTRGATSGYLHVDNRTMWIIRIYVDGDYVGNVSRYGDSYGYYGCTNRTLYARAYFDDGSVISWGPTRADICDDYTWRLNP